MVLNVDSIARSAAQTYSGQYEPSWVKFRYGAWYLPPKTWKRMDAEEPLEDPKSLKDKEMSDAKKKSYELVRSDSLRLVTPS